MGDDRKTIELSAPLPGGALSAKLKMKGSHAELELELTGPRTQKRRLSREEAEAFLAEAARLHASGERRDAEHRARVAQLREARAELAETGIDLSCHRCGNDREFEGRRDLLSAGQPEHITVTGDFFQQLRPSSRTYYEYACPRCGSVEWFRTRSLDHPVKPRS